MLPLQNQKCMFEKGTAIINSININVQYVTEIEKLRKHSTEQKND